MEDMYRWEDNIKVGCKEIGLDDVGWLRKEPLVDSYEQHNESLDQ
jgi:hypothetical protein